MVTVTERSVHTNMTPTAYALLPYTDCLLSVPCFIDTGMNTAAFPALHLAALCVILLPAVLFPRQSHELNVNASFEW